MKLPSNVLRVVRGPLLAVAMAGCSSVAAPNAPADEPDPQPRSDRATTSASVIDPVSYDLDSETERLERSDRLLAMAETRRATRIEAEAADQQRRARDRGITGIDTVLSGGLAPYGIETGPGHWAHAGCGRG